MIKPTYTVKEFKDLSAVDVESCLIAHGVQPNTAKVLRENEINGNSLYDMEFDVMKLVNLKLNDYAKIRSVIKSLQSYGTTKEYKNTSILQALKDGHLTDFQAQISKLEHRFINAKQDKHGNTLSHLACGNPNPKFIQLLMDAKASIETRRTDGKTPFLVACGKGHVQVAECLVGARADVNATDSAGYGPLHVACLNRHLNMAKYLVETCKVDIEAVSKQGRTALFLAREAGQSDLVSFVEGVMVNEKKVTESRLCTFDKGVLRAWLWATQKTSGMDPSVIKMLYDDAIGGRVFLCLARNQEMQKEFPWLKHGQWMNIREFIKVSFKSDHHYKANSRGTLGRLKVFVPEEVNLKDAKVLAEGTYGCSLLVSVTGLPERVVLKRNYYPDPSLKSLNVVHNLKTHPNLLNVFGYVMLDNQICFISEYCANGSLWTLARDKKIEISDNALLGYVNQILKGLMHFHSWRIVHRDLRADNILQHANGRIVIADYGLSRKLPSHSTVYTEVTKQALPERWMAPECLRDKTYSLKGDIWSLGIMLYELMTHGQEPYADLGNWEKKIRSRVVDGSIRIIDKSLDCIFERERLPVPSKVINIAEKCLDHDEGKRPDAKRVFELVEEAMGLRTVTQYT
ncbi:hypothetical protein AAMO2058_001250300 [Amorphochlora amoebiformis]